MGDGIFGPTMDLMRSEPMQLVQLIIPIESAYRTISYLGDLGLFQFNDVSFWDFLLFDSSAYQTLITLMILSTFVLVNDLRNVISLISVRIDFDWICFDFNDFSIACLQLRNWTRRTWVSVSFFCSYVSDLIYWWCVFTVLSSLMRKRVRSNGRMLLRFGFDVVEINSVVENVVYYLLGVELSFRCVD